MTLNIHFGQCKSESPLTGDWNTRFELLGPESCRVAWWMWGFWVSMGFYQVIWDWKKSKKSTIIDSKLQCGADWRRPISCTRFSFFFCKPWNFGVDRKTFCKAKPSRFILLHPHRFVHRGRKGEVGELRRNVTPKSLSCFKYAVSRQPLNNKRCSTCAFSAVRVHTLVINTMQHILQIFQSSQVHDSTHTHTKRAGWQRVTHGECSTI